MIQSFLCFAGFLAIVAYVWQPRAQPETFCNGIDGFELEMCQLYSNCVMPLETSYKFQSFHSLGGRPPLSKAYFSPHKPIILLVGPYSTGNVGCITCMQSPQ
jgi:hypothetical protein